MTCLVCMCFVVVVGELRHALHAVRPFAVFISDRTEAVMRQAVAERSKSSERLRRSTFVIGDEFLGDSIVFGSFNVMVRNSRVTMKPLSLPMAANGDAADDDAAQIVLFSCDRIGRFKTDEWSAAALMDAVGRRPYSEELGGPLRFSDVDGLVLVPSVVERLLLDFVLVPDRRRSAGVTSKL